MWEQAQGFASNQTRDFLATRLHAIVGAQCQWFHKNDAELGLVGHHGAVRARSNDHYWGVVLDAPDPPALGRFYAELLDWKIFKEEPNHVTMAPPDGVAYLAIQSAPGYVPPVWPAVEGRQQMMSISMSRLASSMLRSPRRSSWGRPSRSISRKKMFG